MRERSLFFRREDSTNSKNPKKTYFLICEGICTEKIYFDALGDMLRYLNKDAIINLKSIDREAEEISVSNPQRIVDMVLEKIEGWKENSKLRLSDDENDVCYASEIDDLCFVFDRDRKSFKDHQYNDVYQKCIANGFRLYISNPCFEFWLLLHFDEIMRIDRNKLLENRKVGKRTFTENELHKLMPYSKNNYDGRNMMNKIPTAIDNEKRFCENLKSLKSELGSNVGRLVNELLRLQ